MFSTSSLVPTTPILKSGGVVTPASQDCRLWSTQTGTPTKCYYNQSETVQVSCLHDSAIFLCDISPTRCKSRHMSIILDRQPSSVKTDAKRTSRIAGNAKSNAKLEQRRSIYSNDRLFIVQREPRLTQWHTETVWIVLVLKLVCWLGTKFTNVCTLAVPVQSLGIWGRLLWYLVRLLWYFREASGVWRGF